MESRVGDEESRLVIGNNGLGDKNENRLNLLKFCEKLIVENATFNLKNARDQIGLHLAEQGV